MKRLSPQKKDKIVLLDAGTLDYGDLSFKPLERLGRLVVYPRTGYDETQDRVKGADFVITNKVVFDKAQLRKLRGVRCLHVAATGVNMIDLAEAERLGIAVTHVVGFCTETVVQATLGFLLALAGNLVKFNQACHSGRWSRSHYFMLPAYEVFELHGKTLGIVGYGNIGRRVAEVARAFGMKILIAQIPKKNYSAKEKKKRVPFVRVLKEADFISIHTPLSDLTRNLFDARVLAKMKKGSGLINMARGGIVDERALKAALARGHLSGAACDVLSVEPPPPDHVLLNARNLLMSPHMSWASFEARTRLIGEIALNIKAFQQRKKRNRVV